jgi:cytosine permease
MADHTPGTDYARSRVPPGEGRGWFRLAAVFIGICIGIPPMVLGSDLAAGLGLGKAISATLWSSVIAMPICALAAYVGTKTRLSTGMTLRSTFGTSGAKLISAMIAVDMFCWSAMNMELFADSVGSAARMIWPIHLAKWGLLVGSGLLMTVVTIYGYRSIEKVSFLMVPMLSGVMLSYFFYIFHKDGIDSVLARPTFGRPIEYFTAVSVMVGSYLNLSVLLPDYTRYSKSPIDSAIAVVLGLCLGLPIFVLLASYLTAATGEPDFVKVMIVQGWGSIVIVTVALACWFHMNSCLYSASLNLAAITNRVPKWKLTVAAGLLSTVVTFIGIVAHYVSFLAIISVLMPPITGVYTADYIRRKNSYDGNPRTVQTLRLSAVASLCVGVLVGFATAARQNAGFGLFHLTHLPTIDSFLVSFVCQLLLADYGKETQGYAAAEPDHPKHDY